MKRYRRSKVALKSKPNSSNKWLLKLRPRLSHSDRRNPRPQPPSQRRQKQLFS